LGYFHWGTRKASPLSSPTIVLILLNCVVYVILLLGGAFAYTFLALSGNAFYQAHAYWQIVTSMFVHFGILHIAFNMYGLYYFGRINEIEFSIPQYLAIYFGSGLIGNIASLLLLAPDTLSGGASGAIFGLLGSYVILERRARRMGMALAYAAFILIVSALSAPDVNNFAHLAGLIGGLSLGLLFTPSRASGGYSVGYTYTT
jgi:rhomboid protease GluP